MISSVFSPNLTHVFASPLSPGLSDPGPENSRDQNITFSPIKATPDGQRTNLRIREQGGQEQQPGEQQASANTPITGSEVSDPDETHRETREKQQLLEDQRLIAELSSRDREVRAHEQAHAAVGGQYAGAPRYQYERGPDSVNYAVSGEVAIDVGKAATPEATLLKAQIVRRAALAPAEPSPQDRSVAAQASRLEAQARAEIASRQLEETGQTEETEQVQRGGETGVRLSTVSADSGADSRVSDHTSNQASANNINQRINQIISSTRINSNSPGGLLSQFA